MGLFRKLFQRAKPEHQDIGVPAGVYAPMEMALLDVNGREFSGAGYHRAPLDCLVVKTEVTFGPAGECWARAHYTVIYDRGNGGRQLMRWPLRHMPQTVHSGDLLTVTWNNV